MIEAKLIASGAVAGLSATVLAADIVPVNSDVLEALGRWPASVVLGAVCIACVYFMYRLATNAIVGDRRRHKHHKQEEDEDE